MIPYPSHTATITDCRNYTFRNSTFRKPLDGTKYLSIEPAVQQASAHTPSGERTEVVCDVGMK